MDNPGFHFGRLIGPSQFIGPFAINLDRRKYRRHLFDVANEPIKNGNDLYFGRSDIAGSGDRALGVIGIAGFTPSNGKPVFL